MTATFDAAREAAHQIGSEHRPGAEVVPLCAAHGRTLAAPVRARTAVPRTDTSAMDGWAVAGDGPWRLDGAVRMGAAPSRPLPPGRARHITTGGAVPVGTTAVLRSERGHAQGEVLTAGLGAQILVPGADIRRAGETVAWDATVTEAGVRVTPAVVAAAAVAGVDEVTVTRAPRVALVLLGDEVVQHGVPAPGQVRDAFGVALPEVLRTLGLDVRAVTHLPDDSSAVAAALRDADADLIITTGGTGHGSGDHLVPALVAVGASVLARGVAVKPGHPTVLARRADGVPVLGLPGNPFAAMVALVGIGVPLCAGLLGSLIPGVQRRTSRDRLEGAAGCTRLVAVVERSDGVEALPRQGPAMVGGLVGSDAIAVVPSAGVRVGAPVDVLPLPWCR